MADKAIGIDIRTDMKLKYISPSVASIYGYSVEEMMEKLKAAGYELVSDIIAPNPHIKFFFVKDPVGVTVQFVEMK